MDLVWREPFRIRFYEAEPTGFVKVSALCRYLEEAADCHCRVHGLALSDLRATGRMWVLTRLALRLTSRPTLGEQVTVETWGSNRLGGVRAYRDFRFVDAGGAAFGEANSVWLMLDTATRRPLRLPESILSFRHPERSTPEPVDAAKLPLPERPSEEERIRVHWRHLDANGHANNVCYVEWALETVPLETRRNGRLTTLDIQFVNEARLDEEVICSAGETASPDGPSYLHTLRTAGGQLLAAARTDWIHD